jgi:predicted MPP superfamily phosphohydrolase
VVRFLLFYFIAYGGAHLYFYRKVKAGGNLSRFTKQLLAFFLLLLFISPLAARSLESSGLELLPELLSNTGYLWMGLLFLFVTAAAVGDVSNFLLYRADKLLKRPGSAAVISPATLLRLAAAYALIIGIYGWHEAKEIRTEHLVIRSGRIPATVNRLRIVQISDVHAGQVVSEGRIRTIIECIKAVSPDILVSTGDLVDGHQRHLEGLDRLFLEVTPRLGKYAVLGNHEYYVGVARSLSFMRDAGFRVLNNENFDLGDLIRITGIDDSRNKEQRLVNNGAERALLTAPGEERFRLLLKHRPVVASGSAGRFDLQLSGHVHKGQIFPFNLLTWLSFPVKTGLTELSKDHFLYVSRGTGVWGPPLRFLAPPEVTVIDLLPEKRL